MISIIVPVYQEHPEEVRHLVRELLSKNGESVEIIVVDGDPEKGSLGMLQGLTVKRVAALPGRGGQMNAGAQVATGDVLLFLHADSVLPDNAAQLITDVLRDPAIVGGAFDLRFNRTTLPFTVIAKAANIRSRLFRIPFGDQGIFIRRERFSELKGFARIPLMEDIDLMKKVRHNKWQIKILSTPIQTSARRWESRGVLATTLTNLKLQMLYKCGVSPRKLAESYYGKRSK